MQTDSKDKQREYSTPARVQAWFLQRSRDNWKHKYMDVKADAKRLQNCVNDVSKSREHWRQQTEQLTRRVKELEAANAELQRQLEAQKKTAAL